MEPLIWPILLLLLAVLTIFLEVFVPSGGILGVVAAICLIASLVLAFSEGIVEGTLVLLAATLLVPAVIAAAIKWWPHTPLGKLILIRRPESASEVLPDTEEYHLRDRMLGKCGVAAGDLLPSGDVRIDGRTYDAVSRGMVINRGEAVKVVAVDTQRLVVRPLTEAERRQLASSQDVLATPLESLGIEPFEDPLA